MPSGSLTTQSIRSIENTGSGVDAPKHFLTTPLPAERFYNICDQMLDLHCHTDMLNAAGSKKPEDCRLDPNYVYLDTCSTFNKNSNPDIVTKICTISRWLKSHSGVDSLGVLKPGSSQKVWQTLSHYVSLKRIIPSHVLMK